MLGVPGEQPLTISVTELSPAEAQQLLRQMSQAHEAHWFGLGLALGLGLG